MHLVSYSDGQAAKLGVVRGDTVLDISEAAGTNSMLELLQAGSEALERIRVAVESAGEGVALASVRLLTPIPNPSKVVAIGLNYMDHCIEQNVPPPKQPLVFAKFPSSIIGPGDVIEWDSDLTQQVDYEAELGVVIGKRARNVSIESALDYVFGYTCINDVSARDLQFGDVQWVRGKSLDTFCPVGPGIVTSDDIPDPQALSLRCLVNGEALQDSSTSQMIFGVAEIIAYVSRAITLEPGDLISTGTPLGVGMFRDPKIFLGDGDVVQVVIEKIGTLENPCKVHSGSR